jgi:signal transduction histidine kinase
MPIKFYIPEMMEGEEMKIFLRKHLMFLISPLATIFVMIILPTVGIFVLYSLSSVFLQSPIKNFVILIMSTYILLLCGIALFIWFRYYYSYLIVTNLRIIEIEQRSLFNRVISELELLRVEDIKALVRGILATFLRYGDVLVETAGATEDNFLFEKIPHASYVGSQILELAQRTAGEHVPALGGRAVGTIKEKGAPTPHPLDKGLNGKIPPGSVKEDKKQDINVGQKPKSEKVDLKQNKISRGKILYERKKNGDYNSSGSDEINTA